MTVSIEDSTEIRIRIRRFTKHGMAVAQVDVVSHDGIDSLYFLLHQCRQCLPVGSVAQHDASLLVNRQVVDASSGCCSRYARGKLYTFHLLRTRILATQGILQFHVMLQIRPRASTLNVGLREGGQDERGRQLGHGIAATRSPVPCAGAHAAHTIVHIVTLIVVQHERVREGIFRFSFLVFYHAHRHPVRTAHIGSFRGVALQFPHIAGGDVTPLDMVDAPCHGYLSVTIQQGFHGLWIVQRGQVDGV